MSRASANVHDRLASYYDLCAQNEDISELVTLARTISRWEEEILAAILTGVTNARSESLNRIAKLEARKAYAFRNPRTSAAASGPPALAVPTDRRTCPQSVHVW